MSPEHGQDSSRWIAAVLADFEPRLVRYAAGITGDADRARDVVQDVFLQLCRSRREALESHLAAWLFKVCRHRALDVRRKEQRMKLAVNGQLEREAPAVEDRPSRFEFGVEPSGGGGGGVLAALAALPERQQDLLRLKFQGGLSYAEIARVMDLTTTNVGFLIHAALKKLREQLNPPEPVIEPQRHSDTET
jgi:RNA polymerase sigma-70 factor (ECF subfamily)